jgi:hypothetical protein
MATEQELAQALAPAFGMYPKAFRGNYGNPQDAANLPVDVLRGRTAGLLGLPGDLLNMLQSPKPMEAFGDTQYEPKIKVPYDTERFLQTLPLAPTSRAGQVAGQAASFVPLNPAPIVKAGVAGAKALAPTAANMAEQYMVKTGGILPLDVYHGTPHTLPPTARNPLGEFDASKIGTGEGAQAYGHGIYTAQNPNVAIEYKKALSNPEVVLKDGTRISNPTTGSPEDVAKAWLEEAYLSGDKTPFDTAIKKVSMLRNSANSPKQFDGALDVLNNWKKSGASVDLGGNLYKANLPDAMIPKMLDWNKPLRDQPEILKMLESAYRADYLRMFKDKPGSDFYKAISGGGGVEDLRASGSSELQKLGIPGIKYLDEGSRIKGEGTRNFVTFPGEEKNLTILERNAEKSVK